MSTTAEHNAEHADGSLARELHELEVHEAALERRTRSLEFSGPLALIFSLLALGLAMGAFVVALNKDDNSVSGMMNRVAAGGNAPGGTPATRMMGSSGSMMGAGGHGRFTSSQMQAAAKGTVYVQLGDYWVAPTSPSVRAGKVTFVAKNVGQVPHELMVERMPIRMDAPMEPNEDAAQGMIPDMDPGKSGRMTMHLTPGRYMLFCNVAGHYAAGQHMVFTVAS
jgi:uncharacterized cupredoxin-like copper-binding protein